MLVCSDPHRGTSQATFLRRCSVCHLDVIYISGREHRDKLLCKWTIKQQVCQDIVLDATRRFLRLGASVYIKVIRLQRGCVEGKMMWRVWVSPSCCHSDWRACQSLGFWAWQGFAFLPIMPLWLHTKEYINQWNKEKCIAFCCSYASKCVCLNFLSTH